MVAFVAQVFILVGVGQIQMTLAPDQPIPASYSDDPLIIEFMSPSDTACSVELTVTAPDNTTQQVSLGSFGLVAAKPRWVMVGSLRPFYGPHSVRARISEAGKTTEISAQFHRIERLAAPRTLPLLVNLNGPSDGEMHALRTLPIQAIGLDPEQLLALEAMDHRSYADGLSIHLRIRKNDDSLDLEGLEALARTIADRVAVWEVGAPEDPAQLSAIAGAIRQAAPGAEVHAVVSSPDEIYTLLTAAEVGSIEGAVLRDPTASGKTLGSLARRAERAGFEGFPIRCERGPSSETDPAAALRDLVDFLSAGAVGIWAEGKDVYNEGTIGPAYDVLFAATRILDSCTYLGSLSLAKDVRAEVFRAWNRGLGGEEWVIVMWAAPSREVLVPLPIESKNDVELLDLYGNSLVLHVDEDDSLSAELTGVPVFIKGRGGSILQDVAAQEVRDRARKIVAQEMLRKPLDAETAKALVTLSKYKLGADVRTEFLTILRSLPIIEWQWNQGEVETSVAVPILARLADLAHFIAVVEQSSAKPFLDPIEKTLAECARLQGQVRTESEQGRRLGPRVDWLMDEVSRLSAEARQLAASGTDIEAQAVAALAEWRARCLEVAGGPTYELLERAPSQKP